MFTVGVFQDTAWADRGLAALLDDGFASESLSVIAKHTPEVDNLLKRRLNEAVPPIEISRLGPSAAKGPLIGALQGSDHALQSVGLGSAIGRAGFQAHDGLIFETLVSRGGVLVGVKSVPRASDALAKLHAYGAGNAAIGAWAGRV